ncbi:hypothetical protein PFBG_04595 [Plasmodium falciparum 7G8]|uniref:Uncharacterized protein n=1 Tax=Plasmodium falciparum (isolate 7G8) TaxID=57266 RepID=W7FGR6_PLAF8|nr:hypothetical protein PFBG_04595 [Plasmodium falciparum 7G8]
MNEKEKTLLHFVKNINDVGRRKVMKKNLLLLGYGNINKYSFNQNDKISTYHSFLDLEKLCKNKYVKSILYQKASSVLFKNLNKSCNFLNEKWNETFMNCIKKSLFYNPLNIMTLFNLIYYYNIKMDVKNSLFYSYLLHIILMKIWKKGFYRTNIASQNNKKKKLYIKKKVDKQKNVDTPKNNTLRYILFSLYNNKCRGECLKDDYKINLIKSIINKWEIIPFINDKLLLILMLENLQFLYSNNYKLVSVQKVIYYTNLTLKILKLNKIYNYIKGNYLFLTTNMYLIKAHCLLMLNCIDKVKKNKNKIEYSKQQKEFHNNHMNEYLLYQEDIDNKNNYMFNYDDILSDRNHEKDIYNMVELNHKEIEQMLHELFRNNIKSENEEITTQLTKNVKDKKYMNGKNIENIFNLMDINNIEYYEKRFISFLINEKDINKEVCKMNDYFVHPYVNVKNTLSILNECIQFCLNNRKYKFLSQFFIWRARIFFHLAKFHKYVLSDCCKASLFNIYASAYLSDETIEREKKNYSNIIIKNNINNNNNNNNNNNDNICVSHSCSNHNYNHNLYNFYNDQDIYSCYNLMITSLKKMNKLHPFDLYIAYMVNKNTDKLKNMSIQKNNYYQHPKKETFINERKHQYAWSRSYQDQMVLNFIKQNKKKIPFII